MQKLLEQQLWAQTPPSATCTLGPGFCPLQKEQVAGEDGTSRGQGQGPSSQPLATLTQLASSHVCAVPPTTI